MTSFLFLLQLLSISTPVSFVSGWNAATVSAVHIQQGWAATLVDEQTPYEIRQALLEYSPQVQEAGSKRYLFVRYLMKNDSTSLETGGIIVEMDSYEYRPRCFLLVKAKDFYKITSFTFSNSWSKDEDGFVTASFVDSLLVAPHCYPKGRNSANFVVTKFSENGGEFTSNFFTHSSFCMSVDNFFKLPK